MESWGVCVGDIVRISYCLRAPTSLANTARTAFGAKGSKGNPGRVRLYVSPQLSAKLLLGGQTRPNAACLIVRVGLATADTAAAGANRFDHTHAAAASAVAVTVGVVQEEIGRWLERTCVDGHAQLHRRDHERCKHDRHPHKSLGFFSVHRTSEAPFSRVRASSSKHHRLWWKF